MKDILLHTVPTVMICIGLGFIVAFCFRHLDDPFWIFIAVSATASAAGISRLWKAREHDQHYGGFGGKQSRLEAYVPLICGPVAFIVSVIAFHYLNL
jgi:hypothetical protein